jgi:ATP sulfurylase
MSDVELLATGAYSPLEGFMGEADYRGVLHNMRLANGLPWTVPITLAVRKAAANAVREGQEIALVTPWEEPIAILHLEERFPYDGREEARLVYGTDDARHPGAAYLDTVEQVIVPGLEVHGIPAQRAWSRVVAWGRDYQGMRSYVFRNRIEATDGPAIRHALEHGHDECRRSRRDGKFVGQSKCERAPRQDWIQHTTEQLVELAAEIIGRRIDARLGAADARDVSDDYKQHSSPV